MSKRVTVNLPDDVADRLDLEPNVSAYVTDALRERMEREQTRALLAEHGIPVTADGIDRARRRRLDAGAKMTSQRREELRQFGRSA
jgi:hypothetical protein